MMFSFILILFVGILSIAVPVIFALVKDKGKTQYKLTANICCLIIALILCFSVQYLLGASLSDTQNDMQDTTQNVVTDDGVVTVTGSWQLNVGKIFICGLAGYAVYMIIIYSTYKLQLRLEVNKMIK